MSAPPINEMLSKAVETTRSPTSVLIRRMHLFTGLFLAPWMLMYALSTLVMTHRDFVRSFYPSENPAMVTERELDYSRSFPESATREQIGQQILLDIGLDGTHYVSGGKEGKPIVVNRQQAITPRRIIYEPSRGKIRIEREEFRASSFLERMHRRRGYNSYSVSNTWGFTVDLAVITMAFWSLSGIWLWWELKSTRGWGTASWVAGLALFAFLAFLL